MKRIITIILSAILTITVSAQDKNPVEKICEEIYSAVPGLPCLDDKQKSYNGDGLVVYSHSAYFDGIFCTKDSTEYKNKKVLKKMLGIIRHNLDSLIKSSEESHHFESHSHDADTIKYSLCLSNGPVVPKKIKMGNLTYITPDDDETVSLDYTRNKRNYEYRGYADWVNLEYHKNVILPSKHDNAFDKQAYLEKIAPVLKHKDIKSWDFKWSQSEDYDIESNKEDIDFITLLYPQYKNAGQCIGTMYFIPKEKKELAETILTSLDSITLNHTETNPYQRYVYHYNMKDWVMRYTEGAGHKIKEMFFTNYQSSTRVFYGVTSQGYYVAIADTEKNFCIPREWYALKVFDHGKKEYIKGANPKTK